jgi:ABC-type transporter Mla maintaining outer membrane lipid asymmetry ATPase subunit MlaF
MTGEKSKGLKLYLRVSGMPVTTHLLSWTLLNCSTSLFTSVSLTASAVLLRFSIFAKVPFSFWVVFLFASAFAINALCLLITAVANQSRAGLTFAYSFLMLGFLFQIFLTNPNSVNLLYYDNWLSNGLRAVVEWYPGYNYAKVFADVVHFAGTVYSPEFGRYVTGEGMDWGSVTKRYEKVGSGGPIEVPSISDSLWALLRNTVCIYLLSIALELILASNQGVAKNPLSIGFIRLTNWLSDRRRLKVAVQQQRSVHHSVEKEELLASDHLKGRSGVLGSALVADCLSKNYHSVLWPVRQRKALDSVTFTACKDELLTILGENGAGKTTLINLLTGNDLPTGGNAWLFGKDIMSHLELVRGSTSLCPQSDVYWEELTVGEHLTALMLLKEPQNIRLMPSKMKELLEAVELTAKESERVKNLSGGMRRRLSIAMAIIGDPKVLIFDEPTVGLDPIKRSKVLEIIKVESSETQTGQDRYSHDSFDGRGGFAIGQNRVFEGRKSEVCRVIWGFETRVRRGVFGDVDSEREGLNWLDFGQVLRRGPSSEAQILFRQKGSVGSVEE